MLQKEQLEQGRRYVRPEGDLVVEIVDFQHELMLAEPNREYIQFEIIKFKHDDRLQGAKDRVEVEDFMDMFEPYDRQYIDHKRKLDI